MGIIFSVMKSHHLEDLYIKDTSEGTDLRKLQKLKYASIYVTGPDKTGLIALFCISRNTNFNIECTVLLWWLDTVMPDILYNKCSYIRYSSI